MHPRTAAPSDELHWIREAWSRLAPQQPLPPDEVIEEAGAFLAGVVPRGREEAAVVWLLARRRMPRARPPFDEDAWIQHAARDIYLDFEGRGYGTRRVLTLLERWARWMHAEGLLGPEALGDLLGDLDHSRFVHGFPMKRAPEPRPLSLHALPVVLHRFDPVPRQRQWAATAFKTVLAFLDEVQGRPGRVFALDAEAYALDLRTLFSEPGDEAIAPDVVACAGDVTHYLSGSPHLPEEVGRHLAARLRRLAAGLRGTSRA